MCDARDGDQLAAPEPPDERSRFRARATMVLFVFVLWFLLIVGRTAQFMLVRRAHEVNAMTRESVVYGEIPPLRGSLLDRDGRRLAWSERRMRLLWQPPTEDPEAAWSKLQFSFPWLPAEMPAVDPEATAPVVIAEELTPDQALAVKAMRFASVQVEARIERFYVALSPVQRNRLGEVRREDGQLVGVSGLEQDHDALLAGQPGVYRVVLDKRGHWVPETWQVIQPMRPGYNVHVALAGGK